ncbi:MAG TPA: hypothetical protein VHW70_14585 [Edaphobacter sp.]|jgi:hypothetical protein|nr:hypothetical protein [Edaphobacter sp.]
MIQHMARMARCLESLNQMPAEEMDDYLLGFSAGLAGEESDQSKSKVWIRAWEEAQETFIPPVQIPSKPN